MVGASSDTLKSAFAMLASPLVFPSQDKELLATIVKAFPLPLPPDTSIVANSLET